MCLFMALFIITLFTASFTLGRYSSVENSDGIYSGDIEYVVSDQVVIYTVEDFYTAIKNGYSNIKIADSVQDPFIISGTVSEVRTDLTIDLNGHQIQRNSRLPLLQVVQNVYLTILDSKSGGSLYNPVGSVLQVSGGTLTIAAGAYESGPRGENSRHAQGDAAISNSYNEYTYVDTNGTIRTPVGAMIGNSATLQVTTNNAYQAKSDQTVPIIIPSVDVDQEHVTVNGNMYFSTTGYSQNPTLIPADTYLYFTIDSDTVDNTTILSDAGGADYFYSYYLTETNSDGQVSYTYANSQQPGGNNVEVTVFIYNDVKDYITDDRSDHVRTSFAAIEIESGNLYARNGDYYSYFGVNNTYCVDSEGGYMSVTQGDFYSYENGVCVTCSTETATGEMLNISNGSFYSELGDTVRVDGGDMEVASGTFTKDVGNATATGYGAHGSVIDISGGELKVTTRATFNITGSGINGIYSHDGANSSVNVTGATFNFNTAGNNVRNCAINAGAGTVECYGTTKITFGTDSSKAERNLGIYSAGGNIDCYGNTQISINGSGAGSGHNYAIYTTSGAIKCGIPQTTNEATGLDIDIATAGASDYNYGIYSTGGGITAYGETDITIGTTGAQTTDSLGIYSAGGDISLGSTYNQGNGSVVSRIGQTTIAVNGDSSSDSNFGIQAIGGTIDVSGDTSITVYGTGSTGVYSTIAANATSGGTINISGQVFNCTVGMHGVQNLSSTAISTAGGNIVFNVSGKTEDGTQIPGATINSDGLGITAFNMRVNEDGTLDSDNPITGSGNVTFSSVTAMGATNLIDLNTSRGTAVYVQGGSVTINSGVTFDVESNTSWELGWQQTNDTPHSHDGILVNGGSLISNGTLNVKHIGVVNDTEQYEQNGFTYDLTDSNAYINHQIKSYAVRVEGPEGTTDNTNVTIVSGTISNSIGGGLFVANGTVNLSNATVQANGTASDGNYASYTFNSNWTYYASMYGGHAVEVENGKLNIYSGQYSSNQGNGILVRNGNVRIENGIFKGNDFQSSAGAGASYAFKMYGGTVTITDGIFGNSNSSAGGAFVMGVSSLATANIDGGDFVVGGSTGFSVYTNSAVRFGGENGNTIPYVSGVSTGLAIENSSGNPSTITINNGVFESTETVVNYHDYNKHGIAFLDDAATLTIAGGQFVSQLGSGLYFSAQPSNNNANISISSGEFFGNERGTETWFDWGVQSTTYGGAISGSSNFSTNNMFDSTFYGYKAGSDNYWSGLNRYSWRVNVTKGEQDSSTHKYNFSVELYAGDGNLNEISSNNYGKVSGNINGNNCAGYTYITTTNYGT